MLDFYDLVYLKKKQQYFVDSNVMTEYWTSAAMVTGPHPVLAFAFEVLLYLPQTMFVGVYCFHIVHPSFRPSMTFWFLIS